MTRKIRRNQKRERNTYRNNTWSVPINLKYRPKRTNNIINRNTKSYTYKLNTNEPLNTDTQTTKKPTNQAKYMAKANNIWSDIYYCILLHLK